MRVKNLNSIYPSFISALELPQDICLGMIRCTAFGNREALIENTKCILEYTNEVIFIKGKNQNLQICGNHLFIAEYTKDYIRVCGEISCIQFV